MNRRETSSPSNAPLDVFATPTKPKVSSSGLVIVGARMSRKERHRSRGSNYRRGRTSSLRRYSLTDIPAVAHGIDSSNGSDGSSTQKLHTQKSNYDKIRDEMKQCHSITDIAARLRTPAKKNLPPRSNSDGGASGKKAATDSSKPVLRRTSTWGNESSNVADLPTQHHLSLPPIHTHHLHWACGCGALMRDRMKYCGMCGTKKHWTCKLCKFDENLAAFGYCGDCGTARCEYQ
ncbi:expressed unknown protein [Seminavis robusta]|uniref:Uncharacterized protein n=1 Tax=Seminavis robusta TaxID=568900 RepID=A0A9N8DZV8_9STRA|nr:expressed unknown protein [Seminavis robusta]|eukprot:Sro508_g156690.1 n/a (233) ;mRNA; f:20171-20869